MNRTIDNGDGTTTIILTRGKQAVIDSDDLELVSRYQWCAAESRKGGAWYAITGNSDPKSRSKKPRQYMHRLIIGARVGEKVDHQDRNGLNNRRSNIRIATSSQNGRNRIMARGRSGYRGVVWSRSRRKWHVRTRVDGKTVHGGSFTDVVEAAKAYDRLAKSVDGDSAILNFPEKRV